jgi:N-methylhydantoinase A
MGGTSADIALVPGGEPVTSTDEVVGDFPVVMPAIGVSSIGAGGGSVAWLDPVGVLKIGPRSAGADPGPACYGRGGTEPALTDAFVVCGLINPDNFVGGRIRLDPVRARQAIQPVADRLGRSVEAAAEAIIDVALANMYAEFSQAMARHGLVPRDFTLVAFGGAGPVVACFLAAEFHIPRVLVPLSPGTLCALGALAPTSGTTTSRRSTSAWDRRGSRCSARPTPSCGSGPRPGSSRRGPTCSTGGSSTPRTCATSTRHSRSSCPSSPGG